MARRQQEAGARAAQAMQHHGNQQAQDNPLPPQTGQQQLNTPVSVWQQQTFTSTDALLGELLRQVLEMRRDVEAVLAMLREARQRDVPRNDVGLHHHGREVPTNALRHGTPR